MPLFAHVYPIEKYTDTYVLETGDLYEHDPKLTKRCLQARGYR
jgi:hypothetical protein